MLGVPLFLLVIGGILYSLKLFASKASRGKVLLLWSMLFPQYILMGSIHASLFRYIVPLVPVLLILTGKMISDYTSSKPQGKQNRVNGLIWNSTKLFVDLNTIAADLTFTNDSRYLLHDWISRNVEEGSKIEISLDYPNSLNDDRYIVIKRPVDLDLDDAASSALSNSTYFNVASYDFETQILLAIGKRHISLGAKFYRSTSKGVVEV